MIFLLSFRFILKDAWNQTGLDYTVWRTKGRLLASLSSKQSTRQARRKKGKLALLATISLNSERGHIKPHRPAVSVELTEKGKAKQMFYLI